METRVRHLVRMNLSFHHLNKGAEGKLGLSLVQYHLLITLREMPGCSPQTLAAAVGMHPSSLTQSLKRLQRKVAVFIDVDPRDSRRKVLSLTRGGRDLVRKFEQGIGVLLKSSGL